MSVKAFFGKSIASMLQAHQDRANETLAAQAQIRAATDMERMFGNCIPAMVAFKIDNGFVVRSIDTRREAEGQLQSGFHYCKDHQEVAEHLVATEAKRKMGLTYSPEAVKKRVAVPVVAGGSGGSGQYHI
jgi:hypothetical protein